MRRILWGLAIIIIPAFVLWGAGNRGQRRGNAGMVFGKKVTMREYVSAWEASRNEAIMAYGSRFNEVIDQMNLETQAWDRVIMLREARKKGIKVSDMEVMGFISGIPVFTDQNGRFDEKRYETILQNTFRRTPRAFEEDTRDSLTIIKLVQDTFKDIEVTDEEIDRDKLKEAKKAAKGEKTEDEIKEELKRSLLIQKRMAAITAWRTALYERAGLVSNIQPPPPPEAETPVEEEE